MRLWATAVSAGSLLVSAAGDVRAQTLSSQAGSLQPQPSAGTTEAARIRGAVEPREQSLPSQAGRSRPRPIADTRWAERRRLEDEAAEAEDARTTAQPVVVAPLDLTLVSDWGVSNYPDQSKYDGGFVVGATALMRFNWLGVGIYGQGESNLAQASSTAGIAAGLSGQMAEGVRLDVLGTLSAHDYKGWGGTFGMDSDKPGASATLPCAGGRVRVLYLFHRHYRGHFVLGLQFGIDQDLKHKLVQYRYAAGMTDEQWVGGGRRTVGLVIGGAIDFGRHR